MQQPSVPEARWQLKQYASDLLVVENGYWCVSAQRREGRRGRYHDDKGVAIEDTTIYVRNDANGKRAVALAVTNKAIDERIQEVRTQPQR